MARLQSKVGTSRLGLIALVFLPSALLCAAWAVPAPVPSTPADSDAILGHLNAAISWYRHLTGLDIAAGQPSDVLYLENARNSATQALQLAFQSAAAEAALAGNGTPAKEKSAANAKGAAANIKDKTANTTDKSASNAQDKGAENTQDNNAAKVATTGHQPQPDQQPSPDQQQHGITKALADSANRIEQVESQLADLNSQIEKSRGQKRQQLLSQRDALKGELDLDNMIQDALQKIASVTSNGENGNSGLAGQINQLKQSVPEIFAAVPGKKDAAAAKSVPVPVPQNSNASRAQSTGLFGQTSILFGQMRDMHDIDQLMAETLRLRKTAEDLDVPLRGTLKSLIQQGRQIVNRPPTSDPAETAQTRHNFEALTAQFKQVSDAAVPLRQEIILLDECHGDLQEWRDSISAEYGRVLRSLLVRVGGILIALAFVFLLSEVWRRATYRYIHETRRRRQLMLVRRFVTVFLMVTVIALGFISEFSSLATFAGFLTAGIAVALQTVILSVAAYFFLIGRYGVRVGDRLTVSGVTGDVIDVGLVRLYLMELSGTGIDLYPTGRVVVFSNSVMFQAAPFFKQLPGTAYAWHEVAVTLAPDADIDLAERSLTEAVNAVYAQYKETIDRQHALVERLLDTSITTPVPKATLRFVDGGLEFTVRYPVEIQHAAEIDEQVTRKLMETISSKPELKAAVSGSPTLRSPIRA